MTATLSPEFTKAQQDFAAWYDSKSDDMQTFIDVISDRTYYIIDEDEYDAFICELECYGITDAQTFEDAFHGEFEGYGEHILTKFTEEFCNDTGILGDLSDIAENCIDYNQVWYYAFQYDFNVIEFKGNTYFLSNNY